MGNLGFYIFLMVVEFASSLGFAFYYMFATAGIFFVMGLLTLGIILYKDVTKWEKGK
jgi:hypothetical protein